ncbi:MAG: ABC transporter permease [Lachnospiraceae bacterium]|nr:ABC transporter permease [Lachnospiraceae bacterium]
MKTSQAAKMAVAAVLANKLRSFLTMLGIIIGVMAVTLLISLVQGASGTVTDSLSSLGGDQLIVSVTSRSKRMLLSEVEAIAEEESIAQVSPTIDGSGTAKADGNSTSVSITGITEDYESVQGFDLLTGRNITQTDVDYRLSVCVIGYTVAEDLFGTTDVLDETVRISGRDYRIVGVLEESGETLLGSNDSTVFIPITNAQRLLSQVAITSFYAVVSEDSTTDAGESAINSILYEKFGDDDDYSVINMEDVLETIDTVMAAMEMLLGAIAGISLVVGGIGIMNIMLVSVTERTREIGIRKAIGAQKSDIVVQFLIESIVISVAGGIIGMLLSQGILSAINAFSSYSFGISLSVAGIALGFSAMVGIVFGIYPANKAAKLKPINALRYE